MPIARAQAGEVVKIVGTLRATGPTFMAPLSGATCLWYRSAAQVYHRLRYGPALITEERSEDVFVDDESGSALVRLGPDTTASLAELHAAWCYEPPIPDDERNLATTENVKRFLQSHGVAIRYHRTPFHVLRTLLRRERFHVSAAGPAREARRAVPGGRAQAGRPDRGPRTRRAPARSDGAP